MRVKVSEIPEEGLTVSRLLDPAQMPLATPELRFTAPVEVRAAFQRQAETVLVEVSVTGQTEQVCGRCLEHYSRPYSNRFHLDYSVKGILLLEITDDLRQEILLGYPVRFLCREECLGLCPRCGTNLNERSCAHGSA